MRLVRQHRTEGEGRTLSGLPHATALSKPALMTLAWLTVLVSASLRFTMDTASVGRVDSRIVVGASALFAGLLIAAVRWPDRRSVSPGTPLSPLTIVALFAASAAVQTGLPMLVFANRSSDAPPGSVVAFWTTVFVGGALAAGGGLTLRNRALRLSSALLLVVAGAGVLANWERPSSFSLLVRYTEYQLAMLIAAIAVVLVVLLLTASVERHGWPATAAPIAAGSALGGLFLLVAARESLSQLLSPIVMLAAGASAVLYLMILSLGSGRGALISGTAIAAAPAAITLLSILESATGMLGPRPLLLGPVAAACAVGACAVGLMLYEGSEIAPFTASRPLKATATVGLAAAAVGMFAPSLGVAVKGGLSGGQAFAVNFSMAGYETVAGWLAFSVALTGALALIAVKERRLLIGALITSVAGALAWTILRPMPLHTWVSWIPPEVQQDYGTEFASIVFSPLTAVWQLIGVLLVVLATGVASYMARRPAGTIDIETRPPLEEHS